MKSKLIPGLLSIGLLFLSGCSGTEPITDDSPLTNGAMFKILHLNDTHGAIEELPDSEPGMAKISAYVNNVRAKYPSRTILFSSGDMFQGSIDSNISKGKLMIDIMKEMKFDAMTIGNHEFDWGASVLQENREYAADETIGNWAFPFLAGNILDKTTNEHVLGDLSTTFKRGGAIVSIIGSINSSVYDSIDAELVTDYTFERATQMVIAEAIRLREAGSDLIIYSTHDANSKVPMEIADYVDTIFTGHSHVNSVGSLEGLLGKKIPVIESTYNGKAIGEVTFKYNKSKKQFDVTSSENKTNIQSEIKIGDAKIQAVYDRYLDSPCVDGSINADTLRSLKANKIGEITSSSPYAQSNELSIASVNKFFIKEQLDKYHEYDEKVVASSYNAARSEWNVGDITYSDIYKAFPFDNTTVILELTGIQLKQWKTEKQMLISEEEIVNTETYRLVTCTYVINKDEVGGYKKVVEQFDGVYQRHIMYEAFVNHPTHTPAG